MSEPMQLWMFGGFVAWMAFITGMWQIHAIKLAKLEVTLKVFSKEAAKFLHSPHTPELDVLLDRYIKHDGNLTQKEWLKLQELCQVIVDESAKADERNTLAAFWVAMAQHKQLKPITTWQWLLALFTKG